MQWPEFAAGPEFSDGRPDPLDRWTRRLLGHAASRLDALALHPGAGPPYLPFQRWAMRAEGITASPLGLLIHPDWGLWHGYRGALVMRGRLALARLPARASPCEGCARPCLSACPVGAFSVAAYDVAACAGHLDKVPGALCLAEGCAARLACPVRPAVPYGAAQLAFHMAALRVGLRRHLA